MNLEQMKARLGEIFAKLQELENVANYTDEQVTEMNNLTAEYEGLKNQVEAKEKMEKIKAGHNASTRQTSPVAAAPKVEVAATRKEKNGGFESFGDFLGAVRKSSIGDLDARFKNVAFEKNGEDGGFLVPETFMSEIQKKMNGDESLLAKCRQFSISGNSLSLPTDETNPWNGGVQSYWTAEGNAISQSKNKFGSASWKLHKLASLVTVTDELLEDAVALESYIKASAPESIMHKVNSAIISGDGVGKPKGILNSGFKYKVSKEGGQAADTIVAKNVIKMFSHLIPAARSKAVWFINAGAEEQLRMMKDDVGNFIYLAPGSQLNQSPYGLLLGRPVMPMLGSMKALGDEGDIVLADLSYYYAITKGGINSAISTHLYFDKAETAYRFIYRIDGACPFKTAIVTEFGSYSMSAFITLEDR